MQRCSSVRPRAHFSIPLRCSRPGDHRRPGAYSGIRSLSILGLTIPTHPPVANRSSSEQQVGGGTSSRSSFGRRELISLLRRFLVVSPPIRYPPTPPTKSRSGSLFARVVFPIGGGGFITILYGDASTSTSVVVGVSSSTGVCIDTRVRRREPL